VVVEHLDRNIAIVLHVLGQEDMGHPTAPDLALDDVPSAKCGADVVERYAHRGVAFRGHCLLRPVEAEILRTAGIDREAVGLPLLSRKIELDAARDAAVAKDTDGAPRGISPVVRGEDAVDACTRTGIGCLGRPKSRGDRSDYNGQDTSKHLGETIGSGDRGAN